MGNLFDLELTQKPVILTPIRHSTGKTTITIEKCHRDQLSIGISGKDFPCAVSIIKNLPVRYYSTKEKLWIIPLLDLVKLAKSCKEYGVDLEYNEEIRKKYQDLYNTKRKQVLIKQLNNIPTEEIVKEMDVIKGRHFPFQSIGSYFAYKGGDVLICDMVGLGKTIQSITAMEKHFIDKSINFCIVICPSTLKRNWEEEIGKFTDRKLQIISGDRGKRKKQYKSAYKNDFLVVNYDLLIHDIDMINEFIIEKGFEYGLIIDECQYIKNRQAKRTKKAKIISDFSRFTIGLSATIIENTVLDLWTIFQSIDPNVFGDDRMYVQFLDRHVQMDWFGNPVGYKNEKLLKTRMNPYLIRRFKEDVLDQLPDRIENNYWVELSPIQRQFYDEVKNRIIQNIEDMEKAEKIQYAEILPMITYLRQCVLSAKLVGHTENISTKTDQLIEFLSSIDKDSKVVLFTHFVDMVELLKDTLDCQKMENICIHGDPKKRLFCKVDDRVGVVKKFNENPDIKILVTSDILREGCNITSANYLINFDLLFNPAKIEQRIGRIDRIGNKHKVINIINFIATNTIEEDVYEKVIKKKNMATDILDNNQVEERLTIKDIKSLLEVK
jgi:SNF2 family DNA or RNA helicase